ncbi:hypothetical protein T552_02810 [Pneumocystis carinii B80]|uniref:Coatomer subunit beta n=1 Tax=Pneumocystis carinii (strain B80) TaxID=1408658 RepID=A0A0W4ZD37_PNEC8|nr:hypothetical protein T552_02810 [Pneumocystis carinii B80]KTW26324.1 hypothetical protein T552_02810 [Pneumocystis carinii B80]
MISYTLIYQDNLYDTPTLEQLKMSLESKDDNVKIEAMKTILIIMLNGNDMPQLLMHVIRFVIPSRNKTLKKLLYYYWEICLKHSSDGGMKQEMILACNAIRGDLQHPNEYIRGVTLRFISKLREPEILEPLLPATRSCLEHRHSYVRKNAVMAVYSIYNNFPNLIPDAPDLILSFLAVETDHTCKRNAFISLFGIDHEMAMKYLSQQLNTVTSADELMQLAIIEFIKKDSSLNPNNKMQYLPLVFELLESGTNTIAFEAATTLTSLTNNSDIIIAIAQKFIDLIIKEADNNVKFVILEKIDDLKKKNGSILDDLVIDVLSILTNSNISIRKKVLDTSMEMLSGRNVEDVVLLLKKELIKTVNQENEENEYLQLLIHSLHICTTKYPQVLGIVADVLIEYIGRFNNTSAADVVVFAKEIVEKFSIFSKSIIEKILLKFNEIKSGKTFYGILWIIGQYCTDEKDIEKAWEHIRNSIGEMPILASEQKLVEEAQDDINQYTHTDKESNSLFSSRKVLPDGTYATESVLVSETQIIDRHEGMRNFQKAILRSLILDGDYYLASVLSSTLVKLIMHYSEVSKNTSKLNFMLAESMLIMTGIIRVGQSKYVKMHIDEDSVDQILIYLKSLIEYRKNLSIKDIFLKDTRNAFVKLLSIEENKKKTCDTIKEKDSLQPDDAITISLLANKSNIAGTDSTQLEIHKAINGEIETNIFSLNSRKIFQLTGFSDAIYAEVYMKVNQFDIILDILLVNQLSVTLQNLSVEFATLGDLKIVERPSIHNLAPYDFLKVQITVRVLSTDTGIIFGNCTYDDVGFQDSNIVIFNDIHINIADYIRPSYCSESLFRRMWTEFEWENKVNISSINKSLKEFLNEIMAKTNMACLSPETLFKEDCGFLSANLYAKSIFGEDALMNVSVEKQDDGCIVGHIRIRSKTQGIALSIGELINKK